MSDEKPKRLTATELLEAMSKTPPTDRGSAMVMGLGIISGVFGYVIGKDEAEEARELFWQLAERCEKAEARVVYLEGSDLIPACWSCGATDGKGCGECDGSEVPK